MERIIFDNGGGITLQLGAWAHHYDDADHAAEDITEWYRTGNTCGWDGHEPGALGCDPTDDEIRNGGYRVVRLRADGTAHEIASEIRRATSLGYNEVALALALDEIAAEGR